MPSRLAPAFLRRPLAHRGLHDAAAGVIENSAAAVRAATAAGYGVEIDLQLSADAEAMVFHDDALDRLTEATGLLHARPAAELRRLTLRGGSEGIPTFAEVLEIMAGTGLPLLVEIKRQHDDVDVGPLEARTAELLAGHDGPAAVMSFNPASVLWFRDHAPEIPRGLTAEDFERDTQAAHIAPETRRSLAALDTFDEAGADFVSYRWDHLPRPETEALRARGIPVLCWTTRAAAEGRAALRHADNVTFEGYRPETPTPDPH